MVNFKIKYMKITKKELIERLSEFPDESIVVVGGHTDGNDYDYVTSVDPIELIPYEKRQWSGDLHTKFSLESDSKITERYIYIS